MNTRARTFPGLIGCMVGCLLSVPAGDAGELPPCALDGARDLDRQIAYSEIKIPLGELVRKVASDTGVPLTAAPDVADEPVAVVVKELPARELLLQLADLLEYRWRRRGREGAWRYEVYQDVAGKQREEALRQAAFRDVEKRFRQEVGRLLEMAALPQDQIQGIVDAAVSNLQRLQKLTPEQRRRLQNSPEERARLRCYRMALKLWSPIARGIAGLLGRLTSQQWALLGRSGRISFSTDPGPGELPLPSETERTFRASQPGLYRPASGPAADDAVLAERTRQRETEIREEWTAAVGYRVTIWLDGHANSSTRKGSLRLNAEATPIRGDALSQPPFPAVDIGAAVWLSAEPMTDEPSAAERIPLQPTELETDAVVGARRRFIPEARPRANPFGPAYDPHWQLYQLLADLARTYGVDLVADAYSNSPWFSPGECSPAAPVTLITLLDRFAGLTHRWDRRGSLVRLRSRTWFFDRPREVPLRWVRRWKEFYDKYGALPLEEQVAVVTDLRDDQLASLNEVVEESALPWELASLNRARWVLRLFASLDPAQRQALWRGQPIAAGQMGPTQRDLFVAALQECGRYRRTPPGPAQGATGTLSLSTRHGVRATPMAARPEPQRTDRPPRSGPSRVLESTRSSEIRHPVTLVELHLQSGPDVRETVFITVAASS